MNKNLERLKKLCSETQNKWEITYGANEIEDLLLEILNLLKTHEKEHSIFSEYFINRIQRKEKFPLEIIIFGMRELQWPEIKRSS